MKVMVKARAKEREKGQRAKERAKLTQKAPALSAQTAKRKSAVVVVVARRRTEQSRARQAHRAKLTQRTDPPSPATAQRPLTVLLQLKAPLAKPARRSTKTPEKARRERRRKEPREERERPAFNLGDVVFGKVIEFTEDVIFIDLSSKAKAIFDLRELLITDDDETDAPEEARRRGAQSRRFSR